MAKKDIYDFVEDVVVETSDVAKNINSVAKEYNTKPSKLDFHIQAVRTFELDNEATKEWVELEGGLLKRLDNRTHYANENIEYKQMYTVRIFQKDDYDDPFRDSVTHLTASKDFTSVYFIVEKGSELHYRETLERDMIELINKKKVLNGILINIRESGYREELTDFLNKKIPVLKEDFVLRVAHGVDSTPQVNDKLEFLYRKEFEDKARSEGRIDHANQGFVITVENGETIIRYTKPLKGIPGRDCRGRLIKTPEPTALHIPEFKVSPNIKEKDSDKFIDYIALKDGNVIFNEEEETYDIEDHVQTGALSFKGTGSINAGKDRDIEIDVKETNAENDAVGMGVKVTVSTLSIEGNVGEHAEVDAHQVTIKGQTHKTSIICADEIDVDIHKGKIFGDKVNIGRLEAGVVEAEVVHIKDAVGGIIRAREITIDNLFSYVKAFSSKRIEITNIVGSENLLVIDLEGYKDGVSEIDETREILTETTQRVEYLQRMLKEELDEVMEVRKAFTNANKRLKKYQQHDIEAPEALMEVLRGHQEFLEHYKEMKEELKIKKEKVATYQKKFDELEHAIFDAEISVHDDWKGYNKIQFKLLNPKKTLEKIINEGNRDATFRIEKIKYEDEQFEITTETLSEVTY
jgi:hypothetical protein